MDDIKFNIGEDGELSLCVGPFSVQVCETVDDFEDFKEAISIKLDNIADELKANGCLSE